MAILALLDQERSRYTVDGPMWGTDVGKFIDRRYVSVADEETSRSYYDGDVSTDTLGRPLGFVNKHSANQELANVHLKPIMLYARPMWTGVRLGSFSCSRREADIYGIPCVLIESGDVRQKLQLFLDPKRDYSVLRLEETMDGELVFRLDISELIESDGVWLPASWRGMVFFAGGILGMQFDGTVVEHEISLTVEENEFELAFPAKTEVLDRVSDESYIMLADGSKRIITSDERNRGATYTDILATPSGKAGFRRGGDTNELLVLLLGLLIFGIAAITYRLMKERCQRSQVSDDASMVPGNRGSGSKRGE